MKEESHAIVKGVQWVFDIVDGIVDVLESTAVNTVSALSPWMAPIIPATIVYYRLIEKLAFPSWLAFVVGMNIEFLGLSSVHTTIKFWRHNRQFSYTTREGDTKVSKKKEAPTRFPVGTFVFYLVVVLSITVMMELPVSNYEFVWIRIFAITLLSLLSVPASIIVASRSMYKELLDTVTSKKVSVSLQKEPESSSASFRNFPKDWRKLSRSQKEWVNSVSKNELVDKLGLSEKTAYNWKSYADQRFNKRS